MKKSPINLSTDSKVKLLEFFSNFDVIFTDCDGVLVKETVVIDRSNIVINSLLESGKRIFVVSNNNQTTRELLLKKLQNLDFNLTLENIFIPPYVTAQYLKSMGFDGKAYVIGPEELGEELTANGIENFGTGRDDMADTYGEFMARFELDESVGAVIVGLDKFFGVPKLLKAMNYLRRDEVLFIGTNGDIRSEFPGFVFPDSGPIISAIEKGSYRKAKIMGKPSTTVFDLLNLPFPKERMLMIGDRLSVDIAFGNNAGIRTLLVESGDDKMKDVLENVEKAETDSEFVKFIPDYVIESLGGFL